MLSNGSGLDDDVDGDVGFVADYTFAGRTRSGNFVSDSDGDCRRFDHVDVVGVFCASGTVLDVWTQNGGADC